MVLHPFSELELWGIAGTLVNLYVIFGGKTRPANFDVCTEYFLAGEGEPVSAVLLGASDFEAMAAGLKGLHEHSVTVTLTPPPSIMISASEALDSLKVLVRLAAAARPRYSAAAASVEPPRPRSLSVHHLPLSSSSSRHVPPRPPVVPSTQPHSAR